VLRAAVQGPVWWCLFARCGRKRENSSSGPPRGGKMELKFGGLGFPSQLLAILGHHIICWLFAWETGRICERLCRGKPVGVVFTVVSDDSRCDADRRDICGWAVSRKVAGGVGLDGAYGAAAAGRCGRGRLGPRHLRHLEGSRKIFTLGPGEPLACVGPDRVRDALAGRGLFAAHTRLWC